MPVKHRRNRRRRIRRCRISRNPWKVWILILLLAAGLFCWQLLRYFRAVSSAIAVSDAEDCVVDRVNQAVLDMTGTGEYSYDYFVSLSKDDAGRVVSLNTNMSRINAFSSELLYRVARPESENIQVTLPLGNLAGSSMLMGKGPDVTVNMMMFTSAYTTFQSELAAAGINQTEHRLTLHVIVNIDVLVPWGRLTTETDTEVIIAETVILGEVPNLYVNTAEE